MTPTPAQQISLWADKLRDISAMGLRFSHSIYDKERYEHLQQMALEMLALATDLPTGEIERLKVTFLPRPTPFATGDAAIINARGEILLIRRADNQKWAMPGGALAVGETPAEGVVREAFEETAVRCEPLALIGVHDSRLCGTVAPAHLYHFLFLCRPLNGGVPDGEPSYAHETLGAAWFAADALPPDIDPGHVARIPEAFRVWRGDVRAYFDR
ncbi:MAG: NUDIX hydrolase N-terminal domain-containing protein [Chloroflexi bacterium]|nr:NUDIX hydrolase N-terminal domain-containing protein [Chloroflexota bacterium]